MGRLSCFPTTSYVLLNASRPFLPALGGVNPPFWVLLMGALVLPLGFAYGDVNPPFWVLLMGALIRPFGFCLWGR